MKGMQGGAMMGPQLTNGQYGMNVSLAWSMYQNNPKVFT